MASRQSPTESAKTFAPGTIKLGNDKNKWIIATDKNGRHRWQKLPMKLPGKIYTIHDNGGSPYKVTVNGNSATVHSHEDNYSKIILKFPSSKKIFIGKDPNYHYTGNTILINTSGENYVWIGNNGIIQFKTPHDDPIITFKSPVGNNDVPYAYALSKTRAYLFIELVILDLTEVDQFDDPYEYYYKFMRDHPRKPKPGKKLICKTLVPRDF